MGFAEGASEDKRLAQIKRLGGAMMLDPLDGCLVEVIKTERILGCIHFGEEAVTKRNPLFLIHLTFKERFLNARAIVLTGPGHATESASAVGVDS
jgi:hypothetical protein